MALLWGEHRPPGKVDRQASEGLGGLLRRVRDAVSGKEPSVNNPENSGTVTAEPKGGNKSADKQEA